MTYRSPLHQQLRSDIRPPLFAAELLLSDESLPHPWFGKGVYNASKSLAFQWLDAHDLITRSSKGDGSMTWTIKGEAYRARIRRAGLHALPYHERITALWAWAKAGNGPSVWHGVTNGMAWS